MILHRPNERVSHSINNRERSRLSSYRGRVKAGRAHGSASELQYGGDVRRAPTSRAYSG